MLTWTSTPQKPALEGTVCLFFLRIARMHSILKNANLQFAKPNKSLHFLTSGKNLVTFSFPILFKSFLCLVAEKV